MKMMTPFCVIRRCLSTARHSMQIANVSLISLGSDASSISFFQTLHPSSIKLMSQHVLEVDDTETDRKLLINSAIAISLSERYVKNRYAGSVENFPIKGPSSANFFHQSTSS